MSLPDLPDKLFTLPETLVDDPDLVEMYEVIVHRLREEAAHLPLNTIQLLLIERIAFNYVVLRHKEATDGFDKERNQKEFNTFWLSMTHQFMSILKGTSPDDSERIMRTVSKAMHSALADLPDDYAAMLKNKFAEAFEEAGL